MAYIKINQCFEIGSDVVTTRELSSFVGCFEKGTKVTIIGISERGYDLQDDNGNRILECGFNCVKEMEE